MPAQDALIGSTTYGPLSPFATNLITLLVDHPYIWSKKEKYLTRFAA